MSTQQTAKTQHISTTPTTRLAYREFGHPSLVPLVMLQHFRGTRDDWDPALINRLAAQRTVLLLDNAGVGKSTGTVPPTFTGWAEHVLQLLHALQIPQVDLLGFSMGGLAAQTVALDAPAAGLAVRKLILAGTSASWSPDRIGHQEPTFQRLVRATNETVGESANKLAIRDTFYYPTAAGRAEAKASWERMHERRVEGEERSGLVDETNTRNQIAAARKAWTEQPDSKAMFERLSELRMPVLIANGDKDFLNHTFNSWILYREIWNGRLAIFPGGGAWVFESICGGVCGQDWGIFGWRDGEGGGPGGK